jgi:NAD+ diphosphatase
MLGFHALADPEAELTFEPTEITHARWFTRAEIQAVLADEERDFGLPTPISIAHYLVETWARQA